MEFTGSEYLRHKAPKAFALAEVVVDEWPPSARRQHGRRQQLGLRHRPLELPAQPHEGEQQPVRGVRCRRGECGLCAIDIVRCNGTVDHRDVFFSAEQKAENHRLCACVSRIAGGGVVLGAVYMLDVTQKVFFGPAKNPKK